MEGRLFRLFERDQAFLIHERSEAWQGLGQEDRPYLGLVVRFEREASPPPR